jgi:transposase-like protein
MAKYSDETRQEVLEFLKDHTYKEVVAEYGVSEPTIAKWVREHPRYLDLCEGNLVNLSELLERLNSLREHLLRLTFGSAKSLLRELDYALEVVPSV